MFSFEDSAIIFQLYREGTLGGRALPLALQRVLEKQRGSIAQASPSWPSGPPAQGPPPRASFHVHRPPPPLSSCKDPGEAGQHWTQLTQHFPWRKLRSRLEEQKLD